MESNVLVGEEFALFSAFFHGVNEGVELRVSGVAELSDELVSDSMVEDSAQGDDLSEGFDGVGGDAIAQENRFDERAHGHVTDECSAPLLDFDDLECLELAECFAY